MKKAINELKTATIVNRINDALVKRVELLVADGEHVAREFKGIMKNTAPDGANRKSFENAIEALKGQVDFEQLVTIIGKHKESGKNDSNYIQAKTIEKVVKLVYGLATRSLSALDVHTRCLLVNAMLNGKLSSRAAFATLVNVTWGEEISEQLKERRNFTAGTGSTQLSSTKETMRVLGLSTNPKGTKNAEFNFTDEAKALYCERFERIAELVKVADDIDAAATEESEE